MRTAPAPLVAMALLAPAAFSGCLDTGLTGFDTLTVRVTNSGADTMPATLTVTSPSGETLLQTTVQVHGGDSVERSVDATEAGTYTAKAHYQKSTSSGGTQQSIDSSRSHTIQKDDCDTEEAVIDFRIRYSTGSFENQGSQGICVE